MPLTVLVGRRVLGMHAGLSERTPDLEALANIRRPSPGLEGDAGLGYHTLWADLLPDKDDPWSAQIPEKFQKIVKDVGSRCLEK